MTTLEHADIRRILPHRHPVLLVDRVLEIEPGARIVTTKAVTGSEPCYAGLDENLPTAAYAYPVSLLVESFGQSGAVLWLHSAALKDEPVEGTLIFGSARDVTITGSAHPGDVLRHIVEIDRIIGDNAFMRGETWVGDVRIATLGSVLAVVRDGLASDGS
ncbi:3-hydroxyacyl-ACP dehydratase FabZ family protein [Streptomyces scopuliridis]|uniref:3-hydroxyacyl-ACP dehydratase FabZ family protein n=1 Tax=Streptomyces scopuliridis TaxID=452529 RepID=UPI00369A283D